MSTSAEIPAKTHWRNFHILGWEVALKDSAVRMIGPMVLFPFLFSEVGIHASWLGLFPIARNLMSLTGPVGAAWGGGLERKKNYCIRWTLAQCLPFALIPISITFFYDTPGTLLIVLVAVWILAHLGQGLVESVKQTLLVNSIRETWWGRTMGYRQVMTAIVGIGVSGVLWLINQRFDEPGNFVALGWFAIGMIAASIILLAQINEVPAETNAIRERRPWRESWALVFEVWKQSRAVRWLVYGRWARCTGMFINTFVTIVFMERVGLSNEDMWLPVLLITLAEILSFGLASWFVDRVGSRTAMILSGFLMAANGILIQSSTTIWGFVVLFPLLTLAQGLMRSGWPTLLMKMAPVEQRTDYHAAVNLAVLPGMYVAFASGIALVRFTGFDIIFHITVLGSLLGSLCFYIGLPRIQQDNQ